MVESQFQRSRSRYLNPAAGGILCVGSKSACAQALDDGASRVDWDKPVPQKTLGEIQAVRLFPSAQQAKKPDIPAFVGTLGELRTLFLPHPLVPALDKARIPRKLACLSIVYDEKLSPRTSWGELRWPGAKLSAVRGLAQMATGGPSSAWVELGLRSEHLPKLEFLRCELDGDTRALENVSQFEVLTHLELEVVRELDVFAAAPKSLEVLQVTLPTKGFPLQGIATLKSLKVFYVNGARTEIDCAVLAKHPRLEELNVLNSPKLKNVEALLDARALKSLQVLSCGKPFKAGLKERFKEKGFQRLEIDYA